MNTRAFFDKELLLRSSRSLLSPILPVTSQMIVELFLFCFRVRVDERVNGFMTDGSSDSETRSELLDSLRNLFGTLVSKNTLNNSISENHISIQLSNIPFVCLFQEIISVSPRSRIYKFVPGQSLQFFYNGCMNSPKNLPHRTNGDTFLTNASLSSIL